MCLADVAHHQKEAFINHPYTPALKDAGTPFSFFTLLRDFLLVRAHRI